MESLEENVIRRIDNMRDEIIKYHQQSVQIPSENPPSKYEEIVRFTERMMKEIGLKIQIERKNVIGQWGNNNGKTLIFNAHFDTVQAFSGWTKDPFGGEMINGKIYGRGSCDDKSCVTAEIFAAKALILYEPAEKLISYLDIPWDKADLFYIQKLIFCIEACGEITWKAEPGNRN